MKKMLITGGTVFVSRFAAEYFAEKFDVYVLNRNTKKQCENVTLIEADRHDLRDQLRSIYFDVVLDVTAYDSQDINDLLDALGSFGSYIMISSSAVYPESGKQPFLESSPIGENRFWGKYGMDKISAETALRKRVPNAYILRPPYLYGPMNNVYREAFVFDCAMDNRVFYIPEDGMMKLQFLHVEDLCRCVERIIQSCPEIHLFNVGNPEGITVKKWVELCYAAVGKSPELKSVPVEVEQRSYFPFYRYEYFLDVTEQKTLLDTVKPLEEGLKESLLWYADHKNEVNRKPLIQFIDANL